MRWILVSILTLLLILPVKAEELTALLAEAKNNNPRIVAARQLWQAAEAKISQSLSLADPMIGVEYENIPTGSRNLEGGMKMYTFEQMIMSPGKIYGEYQMAAKEAEAFKARYDAATFAVLAEVKSAYFDLLYLEQAAKVNEENSGLLKKLKKSAEARYAVGAVSQADVLMAAAEAAMVENEVKNLANEQNTALARLNALLLLPSVTTQEVIYPQIITLEALSAYEQMALNNRPEIREMKAMLAMADAGQFKSRMEFFPDIKLGVKDRVGAGWDAMIGLSVPLYFWKQGSGLGLADANRAAAEADWEEMKNMTLADLRETWAMADNAQRTIRLYEKKLVPLSKQAIKTGQSAYQVGKIDFLTLLTLEKLDRETKLKYQESLRDYGQSLARLERIIGQEVK